jgi:hypothetical protein
MGQTNRLRMVPLILPNPNKGTFDWRHMRVGVSIFIGALFFLKKTNILNKNVHFRPYILCVKNLNLQFWQVPPPYIYAKYLRCPPFCCRQSRWGKSRWLNQGCIHADANKSGPVQPVIVLWLWILILSQTPLPLTLQSHFYLLVVWMDGTRFRPIQPKNLFSKNMRTTREEEEP